MAIPSLPEELLALIFEQLAVPSLLDYGATPGVKSRAQAMASFRAHQRRTHARELGIHTLQNVCLASKGLHRLAWPILYRDYCQKDAQNQLDVLENSSDSEMDEREEKVSGTAGFLRTLCLKPDYGLALQFLEVQGWTPAEAMSGKEIFGLLQGDATVTALFQWRARGFWLEASGSSRLAEQLHRTLSLGMEDGLVSLLLLMCPNIRELTFTPSLWIGKSPFAGLLDLASDQKSLTKSLPEPDHDIEQEEADYVIAQMFGTPWPEQKLSKPLVLQRLETLTIRNPGVVDYDLMRFAALLTLPSLRTLRVHGFRGNAGGFLPLHPISRYGKSPKLRSLTLPKCQAESKEIVELVAMCPELRELSVSWQDFKLTAMSDNNLDERWTLKYGDIAEAVALDAPNLEMLELNASNGWPNHDAAPKHPFVVGSGLMGLQNLVELRLDDHAIYGSQYGTFGESSSLRSSVPKSVVSLTLYSEDPCDRRGMPVTVSWLKYQDADLRALLEDNSFSCLSSIHLAGRVREVSVEEKPKHNWKSVAPLSLERRQDHPETLVNHDRLDDLGIKLVSRILPYFDDPALLHEEDLLDDDGDNDRGDDGDFGGAFHDPAIDDVSEEDWSDGVSIFDEDGDNEHEFDEPGEEPTPLPAHLLGAIPGFSNVIDLI